jgi:hypothetical protein
VHPKHWFLAAAVVHGIAAYSCPADELWFSAWGLAWAFLALGAMFYEYHASHNTPYCDDIEEDCNGQNDG